MNSDNNKIGSSFLWSFLERIASQGVSFVVSIVLARILVPDDYGIIAIVQIFIAFADTVATTGLNASIIQKKNVSREDDASAFVLNIILGIFMYLVLFLLAPYVAKVYKTPEISSILRVLAIRIPITAFNAMQRAYVSRNMEFKKFFYSTVIGTTASAIIGIFMAINGAGPWALVFQYLTNTVINTIVLLITVNWRPSICCTKKGMKEILSFGWKVLAGSLVSEMYLELRNIIIGIKYDAIDLAYYKRGQQFPALFLTNVTSSLTSVMFPALARKQSDLESVKIMLRKSVSVCTFVMGGLMFGMAATAESLVKILLTDKWSACIPYLIMYCISYAILPVQSLAEQTYKGLGLGHTLLSTQITAKIIGILFIIITVPFGVFYIGVGMVISTYLSTIVYIIRNNKVLSYSVKQQVEDIAPTFCLSLVMVVFICLIKRIMGISLGSLILQVIIGMAAYLSTAYIFHIPALFDLISMVRNILLRRKV